MHVKGVCALFPHDRQGSHQGHGGFPVGGHHFLDPVDVVPPAAVELLTCQPHPFRAGAADNVLDHRLQDAGLHSGQHGFRDEV